MSPAQQRGLALWAALLSAVVCLSFLPVSRLVSVLFLLAVLGLILALWIVARRRAEHDVALNLDDLPEPLTVSLWCWSVAICRWHVCSSHRCLL